MLNRGLDLRAGGIVHSEKKGGAAAAAVLLCRPRRVHVVYPLRF